MIDSKLVMPTKSHNSLKTQKITIDFCQKLWYNNIKIKELQY